VRLLAGVLTALAVVRALGVERGWLLTLLVGALPLVLTPAYVLLGYSALARRPALAGLSAALVGAHLLVLAPALTATPPPPVGGVQLRLVVANLYVLNPRPQDAGVALLALQPDVLVVPELTQDGLAGLRAAGLLDDLPFAVVDLGDRGEGVGLFSRLPLNDVVTRRVATRDLPRATVTVGGVDVRVLTAHPLPPVPFVEPLWRQALADLADEVGDVAGPLVVAGDLNADRDQSPFRALLDTGLRDAHDERGRGLARTWPAAFPLLHLDHVLVRDGGDARVAVLAVREVDLPGSDHKGVVADLAISRA